MSIALEESVRRLAETGAQLSDAVQMTVSALDEAIKRIDHLAARIAVLEATAARKPGPKPKDSNA